MSTKAKTEVESDNTSAEKELVRYELMLIVTPEATQPDYEKYIGEIKEMLAGHGANLRHAEDWGKRDLAYSIKKKDHGYYYVMDFDMDAEEAAELNKQLRITPFVLRYLIVKLPENYTPQKYDLEEPARPQYKPEGVKMEGKRSSSTVRAPRPERAEAPAAPAAKREAAAPPKRAVKPKKEEEKPKEDLSKLDEKLEELLSGDDDLNL